MENEILILAEMVHSQLCSRWSQLVVRAEEVVVAVVR